MYKPLENTLHPPFCFLLSSLQRGRQPVKGMGRAGDLPPLWHLMAAATMANRRGSPVPHVSVPPASASLVSVPALHLQPPDLLPLPLPPNPTLSLILILDPLLLALLKSPSLSPSPVLQFSISV